MSVIILVCNKIISNDIHEKKGKKILGKGGKEREGEREGRVRQQKAQKFMSDCVRYTTHAFLTEGVAHMVYRSLAMTSASEGRRDFGSFHSSNVEELLRIPEVRVRVRPVATRHTLVGDVLTIQHV